MKMKVFISWSGEFSRRAAIELKNELAICFDSVDPFVSTVDIPKGATWQAVLNDELRKARFGIICLTKENLKEPWINFEAGAVSKSKGNTSGVCTLLFDNLSPSELPLPLSSFQCTKLTKDDFTSLLLVFNSQLQISKSVLKTRIDSTWETFYNTINTIREETTGDVPLIGSKKDEENEKVAVKHAEESASSTIRLSTALPLTGRTRIIYTCRSYFESPPFDCPSENRSLEKSLTASSHIPVDEIETVGYCLDQYGASILGTDESLINGSLACSVEALNVVGGKQLANPRESGEIFDLFADNLIVVGENIFSNRLLYYFCHNLPWRHLTLDS
jgi:hypothetical protein